MPAAKKTRRKKKGSRTVTGTGNQIIYADNLSYLRTLPDNIAQLIYIDPPFNTGKRQQRTTLKTTRDEDGDRIGYKGQRYKTTKLKTQGYEDSFDDFQAFLYPRLMEAHRLLTADGSFFLHIDYREAHYCKIALDKIFGRECFMNEIIWAYDYGARSKSKWPAKHDTIFWYARDPKNYTFNYDAMERIPYMAPGLVGAEKAARGKTPTDVWWHTIVSPNAREKTGYATQKPLGVLERIIKVHSDEGDLILDFFAGSGTTGEAAAKNKRQFLLMDNNKAAVKVMRHRLRKHRPAIVDCHTAKTNQLRKGKQRCEESQIFRMLAEDLKDKRVQKKGTSEWDYSLFMWIKNLPPSTKGAFAKNLIANWCAIQGMTVLPAPKQPFDRVIQGNRVAIKFSTEWEGGSYIFQQLKDYEYDYVICLGLNSQEFHCWVISKAEVMQEWSAPNGYIKTQHKGQQGNDTAWFEVNPKNPPPRLSKQGGAIPAALSIIKKWCRRP